MECFERLGVVSLAVLVWLVLQCTGCVSDFLFPAHVQPQSMAEVLAKKEELADRLEKANEEAIASAIAEEEQLTREIQAENNELERDNESDFSVRKPAHLTLSKCFSSVFY